jgi:hypothetical protein
MNVRESNDPPFVPPFPPFLCGSPLVSVPSAPSVPYTAQSRPLTVSQLTTFQKAPM